MSAAKVIVRAGLLAGALFGVAVWLFMNLVVLPLSATPPQSFLSGPWVAVLIAHVACVGLPIALLVRRGHR